MGFAMFAGGTGFQVLDFGCHILYLTVNLLVACLRQIHLTQLGGQLRLQLVERSFNAGNACFHHDLYKGL